MTQALTTIDHSAPGVQLIPPVATGNRLSRLQEFERWLEETGRDWTTPDLVAYQQYLLERDETRHVGTYSSDNHEHEAGDAIHRHYGPVAHSTIQTYVATIRGRYQELLQDNGARDALYARAGAALAEMGQADTAANRKAYVDEAITRLENGIRPSKHDVEPVTRQDRVDDEIGLRLTRAQADALLASPGLHTIDGLRDTALLAVLLCTGIREAELTGLEVSDLRQTVDGRLCLHIRHGKGRKARAVPWGAGEWALAYVDRWLEAAGILGQTPVPCAERRRSEGESGRVFRSFHKPRSDGSRLLRRTLSTRAVQVIVASYPLMIGGELITIHPHDLRRTYARRCYDAGMDILAIQQNLGHADHKTTLRYIGVSDVESRQPPALYTPPHWVELGEVVVQGRLAVQEQAAAIGS